MTITPMASRSPRVQAPKAARDPRPATSGTAILTKSEIALLAVAVLGTLAAWLTQAHPSPVRPIEDQPGVACNVPAGELRGVGPLTSTGTT
jgi:hypothetical protein